MAIETVKREVPDETFKHKEEDRTMEIYRDQNPVDPRTYDQLGTMATSHKRYDLGEENADTDKHDSWHEVKQAIKEKHDVVAILPLYLYDHSGLRMKTTPFRSRWDSGQVGFIYATQSQIDHLGIDMEDHDQEDIKKWLKQEVEAFDNYLIGEMYRYVLKEDGELLDSCGGFNGYDKQQMFKTAGEDLEDYKKEE